MKRPNDINWRVWGILPLLLLALASCNPPGGAKKLNRRITLWRKDKIPYGTYVAYENLPYIFPDAEISVNRTSPLTLSGSETKKAYIVIVPRIDPDDAEIREMLNFAGSGNHIFISAFQYGDSLLHTLKLRTASGYGYSNISDSMRLSVYHPVTHDSLSFAYPGRSYDNWVSSMDSQYTTILGRDARGHPDLVKFTYKGGGSILLQFAPTAFTNFFLLHKNNKAYYEDVLSYIPDSVKEVIWDEYFRSGRNTNFSALRYIMKNPPLQWAFWLLLGLFGLIYLFDSKRKQRIVPVIPPLRNNSLDFVKTIGRLYYQRRDNQNLTVKMSTHFQDHIRTRYNLPVALSDPGFADRLSYKTGIRKEFLLELIGEMQALQDSPSVTDAQLLGLNRKLEEFYKHA